MNPFSKTSNISALSERRLIAKVCEKFGEAAALPPPFGAGDDCALIRSGSLKKNVYATSDAVILGRHFSSETDPFAAGEKLVKRNVSDIAAMGAVPFAALASSICSPNLSLEWLENFCCGMGNAAVRYGIKIVGGDFASVKGDFFSTHLTLLGQSDDCPLTRTGASDGDYICVTGELGASLESGHHLSFEPRVAEGVFFAQNAGITSCIDLSDGIASDIKNLIPQKLCAEISAADIPLRKYGGRVATLKQSLCDGEDYELLFTFSGGESDMRKFKSAYGEKFGRPFYVLGKIKKANSAEEENALILISEGRREVFKSGGFDHYQP